MFKGNTFQVRNIPNLAMGLNDQMEAGEIMDNEMSDCENFVVDEVSIRSAPGYVSYQNYPHEGPFWGIYHARFSTGTQVLIRQCGDHLEYDNGSGDWTACTLPTSGSPASTISLNQVQPTFAMLNDTIVFCNGQIVMYSTDGVTWINDTDLIVTGDVPNIVISNGNNRLFYIINSKSEIWWSDINSPQVVQSASWQYIDPNNGQDIRGAVLTNTGSLLLFKENSFYEIDDISLGMAGVNLLGEVKLASHHTLAMTENSVILLGVDGIYEYAGGNMTKISGRIKWTGRNNVTNWDLACATYINGEYRVSMPDANVSTSYNCQEYVVHRRVYRNDSVQPYLITRNRRYFGCYGIAYDTNASSRRVRLYAGFSVASSTGSPAYNEAKFVYINVYKDSSVTQGLDGTAQSGYITTKYFTENIPYYAKKYRKFFYELSVAQDTTNTFSYRFTPYGSWTDVSVNTTTGDIEWTFEDGSTGEFSEGFGFSEPAIGRGFIDIENSEKPRGVQFKISIDSINDVIFFGLAYSYKVKPKFK